MNNTHTMFKVLASLILTNTGFYSAQAQWLSTGTPNTNKLYTNGNVGIGSNTNPAYKLTLGTGYANTKLALYDNTPTVGTDLYGIGVQAQQLRFHLGQSSGGGTAGKFSFFPEAGSASELFTITGSGNVGVGAGTPLDKLHLSSGIFRITGSQANTLDNGLRFGHNASTLSWIQSGSSTSVATSLALNPSGGNVGIGLNNPSAKLHVNGNGIFSSHLSVGTSAAIPSGYSFQVAGKSYFNDYVGINTTAPSTLFTISGGDLRIIETNDYSKMPDGNGADIYLADKLGGILNLYQASNVSRLDIGGTSTEFRIGKSFDTKLCTTIFGDGKMAIGADATGHMARPAGYRLYVKEGILTEKLKIAASTDNLNWADYVFASDYKLKPLQEVAAYVKENKHLPDVPSASEVYKNGIDIAQMDATLLKKIEELTLYIIAQEERIKALEGSNKAETK